YYGVSIVNLFKRNNYYLMNFFFFQAEDGIRDRNVTGVQTCALPISCDLPVDQCPKPRLVDFTGGVERGDQGRAATAQPFQMLGHQAFLRMSSSTSVNAYIPRRPTIHRAASSAPTAKPARDRAVWTNSIWSAPES